MADQPASGSERVLIERLESRQLLSAGLPTQPQGGFHWFERDGFGAPSAPVHHDLEFNRPASGPDAEDTSRSVVPSLTIFAAPEGQRVGFVPLFVGWYPAQESSYARSPGFHWAGHDGGHDAPGDSGISGPSALLHTPRLPSPQSYEAGDHDSNGSEASPAPQAPQSLGQSLGSEGSPVIIVVVTQAPSPQIRVITIPVGVKIEPKVALPDDPAPGASSPVYATQGAVQSAVSIAPAPEIERAPSVSATGTFAGAAAASAVPPLKATPFQAVERTMIEAAAVARGAATSQAVIAPADGAVVKSEEFLGTMVATPAGQTTQIAMTSPTPEVAVGAIRIATGWVRSAATVIGRAFDTPVSISDVQAEYATPVAYNFLRISPAMLFNDTVGRMIRESAALSPAAASPRHAGAWAVTGTVVVADAVLVGYWHVNRRRKLRKAQKRANGPARQRLGVASLR